MAQAKDVTGLQFGRLIANSKVGKDKFGIALWNCSCSCGKNVVVRLGSLTAGATKSCGCFNSEVRKQISVENTFAETHGLSKHLLYQTWATMKQRCSNSKHAKFYLYGARGITVCKEWSDSFPTFLSDMGERPEGHTLNRIDNDGPYCASNCEWQTHSEQNRNRRKYKRKIKLYRLSDISDIS